MKYAIKVGHRYMGGDEDGYTFLCDLNHRGLWTFSSKDEAERVALVPFGDSRKFEVVERGDYDRRFERDRS